MKNLKTILALAILCIATTVNANELTVSNLGGSQYPTLLAAYNAATSGQDTLLIEGSDTRYIAPASWNKNLVVIGPGYNANKQDFKQASIMGPFSTPSFEFGSSASGSKFYGISWYGNIAPIGTDLQFEDCKFDYPLPNSENSMVNYTFKNCIFAWPSASVWFKYGNYIGNTFLNCVFNGPIAYDVTAGSVSNNLFDHCLFLTAGPYAFQGGASCPAGTTVKNSIFMNATTGAASCGSITMVNNISRNSIGFTGTNVTNTNLAFQTYTNGSAWSPTHNYGFAISPTPYTPTITGDDLTAVGPHGGNTHYDESGEPHNVDVVRIVNVGNTAAPNGILNVTVTAGKPAGN